MRTMLLLTASALVLAACAPRPRAPVIVIADPSGVAFDSVGGGVGPCSRIVIKYVSGSTPEQLKDALLQSFASCKG